MIIKDNSKPLLYSVLCFLIFFNGCLSNYEPVILEVSAYPNPVKMGEYVSLMCVAIDEDESSIRKKDSMKYSWFASSGSFVEQDTSDTLYGENEIYIVIDSVDQIIHPGKIFWVPIDTSGVESDSGYYTITCQVKDENDATDMFSIIIEVQ